MKLQGYRDDFYTFSGKASDISRQLAFAGIAIIWIFKKDQPGAITIPRELVFPGLFIVLALSFDLLQYCVASVIWRIFYRSKEKAYVSEDVELEHSIWLEVPIYIIFWAKIICVFAAYYFIFEYLIRVLTFT
jgi:hypothetical protein